MSERARELIHIADPKFRDELAQAAYNDWGLNIS